MTKSEEYCVIITKKLAEIFDGNGKLTIDMDELKEGENMNHFFLAFLMSSSQYLELFFGKELDILEVSYIMNRLAVQEILEHGGFSGKEFTL